MNLVDMGASAWRRVFKMTARPMVYARGAVVVDLAAFVRGVRSDDLFAAAMQQDVAGIIDAAEFAAAFPSAAKPQRYDRLRTPSTSYSVEEWRGSPNDDQPVFFKLLLRGGSQ